MTPSPSPTAGQRPCPHGYRHGTVVCLHCRHEERLRAEARLRKRAARLGLLTVAAAAVLGIGAAAISALRGDAPPPEASMVASTDSGPTVQPQGTVAGSTPAEAAPSRPPQRVERAAPAPAAVGEAPVAALRPVVGEGRTPLGDGLVAERRGDDVTVWFDTAGYRTRRYDKFTSVLRSSLPQVYGRAAERLLAVVSAEHVQRAGGLVTELPTSGVRFTDADVSITVWPVVREGQDGPLVVGFRAVARR